jgi:aminoglycoside phosphotransferase (APT) family kinase protein
VARDHDALQQPLTPEHLLAMCWRAFGRERRVLLAKELDGGLYNNTYLVHIAEMPPVILRVAPPAARQLHSEPNLMRNEYASLPFFAPLAPLVPRVLMADFTHQLLERDYLFQTYMEGEAWSAVADKQTLNEKRLLWCQLGGIVREIHTVRGEHFGRILADTAFPRWSSPVVHHLQALIHDLTEVQLDATDIRYVLDITLKRQELLDEVTQPCLLHGDLWTGNILIKRDEGGPRITAILDCERSSWGDPWSEWTMFLLDLHTGTEVDAFWEGYGRPEGSASARFRKLVYKTQCLGGARLEQHRLHHTGMVERSYRDMQAVLEDLARFS